MNRACTVGEILSPLKESASETNMQTVGLPHITVCICTYRRPALLKRLLEELDAQETDALFTFSVVLVDNDGAESARSVISNLERPLKMPLSYDVEPQQSIALARNRAIEMATGDYVAFIDDDEFPIRRWLLTLFRACRDYAVDGVLGPVKRYFDEPAPRWVIRGNFYERATYATGLVIDWRKGRTGNVLLKRELFSEDPEPFRPEFRQGEDQDFFQRMIEIGHRFIWCNEAVAYEVVPPIRWKRTFMLRRALLRGAMEPKTAGFGARSIVKSLVAVPAYAAILPLSAIVGHHKFMGTLISLCDHLGKLLAVFRLNPIKEQYVTE